MVVFGHLHTTNILVAHIGDTFHRVGVPVDPLPGFRPAKAMVLENVI